MGSLDRQRVKLPTLEEMVTLNKAIDENEEETTPDDLLAIAKSEALSIVNEAKKEAEIIVNNAIRNGEAVKNDRINDGLKKGNEMAALIQKEMQAGMRKQFETQMRTLVYDVDEMFDKIKSNLINTICIISHKVIYKEFNENDEIINRLVATHLGAIKDRLDIKIHVSKDDYDMLNLSQFEDYEVVVEGSYNKGDMSISCDCEEINFGLDSQLEKIENAIKG